MARTKKATKQKEIPAEAPEPAASKVVPPVSDAVTQEDAAISIESKSPEASAPDSEPARVQADEAPSSPPGRPWTERFLQPIKYSRSNFKDATGKHLIAFRFDLPTGESKPSEALLEVLRNHKVFKQGKPCGNTEGVGSDPQAVSTGLHYQDFGAGLGKLWVMPNGELGRTVADSLDQALHGLVKKVERGAARTG